MYNSYLEKSTQDKIAHFNYVMMNSDVGSKKYKLAQTILGWLCNELRKEEKLNQEAEIIESKPEKPINPFRYAKNSLDYERLAYGKSNKIVNY